MKFRLPMPLLGNLKALALFAKKTYGKCYITTEEGWMIWWREVSAEQELRSGSIAAASDAISNIKKCETCGFFFFNAK